MSDSEENTHDGESENIGAQEGSESDDDSKRETHVD